MQQGPVASRVHEALDGIVFRTVLSFVAVALVTSIPLLLHLDPTVHTAAHAVLPAAWALYALVIWFHERGRPAPGDDLWPAAQEVDPGGARTARIAVIGLPIGWIAAAIGLLMHHLSTNAGTAEVVGIDFPILAVGWFLASWAWRVSTRRVLATALGGPTPAGGPGRLPIGRR